MDLRNSQDKRRSRLETTTARRYVLELSFALVAYIAILYLSVRVLQAGHVSGAFRDFVAVTPAIPLFAVIAAIVRFIRTIDELQRQIHLEALAISAGITAALALTYTFLEGVGFPHSSAWWAFASIDVFWALSLPFVRRRYE